MVTQNRDKQTWRTRWQEDMTQRPKPPTRLFSATHFYAALISWAFAASQERCGDMRRSRTACPRLRSRTKAEEPLGPPRAPVILIPTVLPLPRTAAAPTDRSRPAEGAMRSWTAALHWKLPSFHIFPGTGPRRPRAYLGSSGGAGAAGGARPEPGRAGPGRGTRPRRGSGARGSRRPCSLSVHAWRGVPLAPGAPGKLVLLGVTGLPLPGLFLPT